MAEAERNLPSQANPHRCVAVDIHPHNFGFVVLENLTVLDCGARACEWTQSSDCLGQRFQRILQSYSPSTVVMRMYRSLGTGENNGRQVLTTAIKAAAVASRITVVGLRPATIRSFFDSRHARTKHEIAYTVSKLLPELAWKLPPQRKLWQSVHYRMSIFDAAAVAVTYVVLNAPGRHPGDLTQEAALPRLKE